MIRQLEGDMAGKLHWYHWLVILASLILTFSAWKVSSEQVHQKAAFQFHFQADQIVELVKERMRKYEDALWAGVAAIQSQSGKTNTHHWHRFAKTLAIESKYPGINGIGVIDYVAKDNFANYLATERQFRPDFSVHPEHKQQEFWPITHIEPVEINQQAVGLDMAHEINRYTAAKKARDTGNVQITEQIVLVQDELHTPGFLFFAPYYRQIQTPGSVEERQQQFTGLVYAPFIVSRLMEGTLENRNRLVNFNILDGNGLLYDELHVGSADYDPFPLFSKSVPVQIYGKTWTFEIQSSALFRQQHANSQPLMILVGGIIIDTMLIAFFLLLVGYNKKAVALANQITQQLQNTESHLEITIDNMMDAMITIDSCHRVLSYNKAAEKMFGFDAEEVIGRHVSALENPDAAVPGIGRYLNSSNVEVGERTELIVSHRQGASFPADLMINKVISDTDSYWIAIIRDLSLKVSAETTKAIMNAAIQASPVGFAILDKNGGFVTLNKALCDWLGYSEADLQNGNALGMVRQRDRWYFLINFIRMFRGKRASVYVERQFRHRENRLIWGRFSAAGVKEREGKISHIVVHIADMQKEKELMTAILQKNQALLKSNSDLEQFAYIASHDLKSPLNAVRQLASWIDEDCRHLLPRQSKEHLSLLVQRTERMAKLLEDLLDYSKVGRYQYKGIEVNLRELVEEQFHLFNDGKRFYCQVDSAVMVIPKVPLEIVLRNLLSNAIKHHDKKQGKIDVTYKKEGGRHKITIRDDGPGIPVGMHNKVVEMFQTLRPRDEVEGSGMGLAMVKRIVNHYKGELVIESNGIRGTSVVVSWPIEELQTIIRC
ncbi:hypothetical protein GCM10009092_35360 [Bowmanella denitrificans]|uniref:histidine kinase n=1 Tax=Bowmanella denitrificans TaxID=366582 RepID=A0ABN0XMN6_9ALTE